VSAALTGRAWRTALGADVGEVSRRLLAGEAGSAISGEPAPSRHSRFLRRMGLYAVEAAAEALGAARRPAEKIGLFAGVGGLRVDWSEMPAAFAEQRDDGADAWERGLRRMHPFWMLRHLSNNAHALISAHVGARGEGVTFGGANAGAQALAAAIRALEDRAIDAALVVAHDSLLEPEELLSAGRRMPGEAAAALLIERPDEAGSRALGLVDAADGADGEEGEPRPATVGRVAALLGQADRWDPAAGLGDVGAATALVQVVALSALLGRRERRAAVAVSTGAPGLVGAVRVEL